MEYIYIENKITRALDNCYKSALEGKVIAPVITIKGLTGSGKTASIKAWLEHHGYKYQYIEAPLYHVEEIETTYRRADEIDLPDGVAIVDGKEMTDLFEDKPCTVPVIFPTDLIDNIDGNTIVVIDNYDAASKETRDELYKFIRNLVVVDIRQPGRKKLKKLVPLMMVIVLDETNLIINDPLTKEEKAMLNLKD